MSGVPAAGPGSGAAGGVPGDRPAAGPAWRIDSSLSAMEGDPFASPRGSRSRRARVLQPRPTEDDDDGKVLDARGCRARQHDREDAVAPGGTRLLDAADEQRGRCPRVPQLPEHGGRSPGRPRRGLDARTASAPRALEPVSRQPERRNSLSSREPLGGRGIERTICVTATRRPPWRPRPFPARFPAGAMPGTQQRRIGGHA